MDENEEVEIDDDQMIAANFAISEMDDIIETEDIAEILDAYPGVPCLYDELPDIIQTFYKVLINDFLENNNPPQIEECYANSKNVYFIYYEDKTVGMYFKRAGTLLRPQALLAVRLAPEQYLW